MANWKYRLDVKADWQAAKAGEIDTRAFARRAIPKIKALPPYQDDQELIGIADELETYAAEPAEHVQWFDSIWESLYNWADQCVGGWNDKMCWVKTNF